MKKLFITLVLTLQMVGCAMAGPAGIQNLVSQYRHREDVDVISVGPMGMSLLRVVAGASSGLDSDVLELLRLTRGVKRITIVDFEDSAVRDHLAGKIERELEGMELIMEAKDDGERVQIFGHDDGKAIRDFILYTSGGTLIMTRGKVDAEKIIALMAND
ncbi:MAG: DUF4252 domain-containing protein [Bacteroidales bacterium]|nr:DUF4252 domain-containing protein [Bacteroidales bacterium]